MIRATTLCFVSLLALAGPAIAQDVRFVPPRMQVSTPVEKPVELRAVRVSAEVSGALAMTVVEMTFHNPNGRVLEGELQFPLLDGQSVVGFALDIDGRMREAVPVEKARAQAVFEDVTRARIDPGLLHVTEGNNYKVRVYPIPPAGERRVLLRYVETLRTRGDGRVYRLPLGYAAGLRDFSIEMQVAGEAQPVAARGALGPLVFRREGERWVATMSRQGSLNGVLDVSIPGGGGTRAASQVFGDQVYFHAEGRARSARAPRSLPRVVQIVWDASGSMASRDRLRERALLDAYFNKARDVEVHLVMVRDAAEPVRLFHVSGGDWSALRQAIEGAPLDGATDLSTVPVDEAAGEVLLFTDGLVNFGGSAFAPRRVPVYTISSTARSAPGRLRHIAESSGGRFIDLTTDSPEAARDKLLLATTRIASIDGNGVRDVLSDSAAISEGRFAVAGVLTARRGEVKVTLEHPDGKREVVVVPVAASDREGRLAATIWATWRVALLESDEDLNRAEIRRVGRAFSLATRETSLLVLDRVEDYVRYEIEPPRELAEAYARLRGQAARQREVDRNAHLERIVKRFQDKQAWWEREFPKVDAPKRLADPKSVATTGIRALEERPAPAAAAPAPADRVGRAPMSAASPLAKAAEASSGEPRAPESEIRLRPWKPDAPYATRMRGAASDRVYRIYLDERPDYLQSSAFFLDAADILLEKGKPELALRVLSNLAEMDLENRDLLRILGYRLVQAGHPGLAIPVFRKVLALAPMEPQSHRDLALALAALKEYQKAVDLLADVVMKSWDARFPDIELIAIAELNSIVATAGVALDTSRVDPRLLRNLPLDLRVVLTWDADNTDIDLWVTDPNGEKAYYSHPLTYQGGRMSADFTGGYGPEEFSLRIAKPGIYKVEANFYGHRQQILAPATTLLVKLITGFGTSRADERLVTLRLAGSKDVIHVGDFEVKAAAGDVPR